MDIPKMKTLMGSSEKDVLISIGTSFERGLAYSEVTELRERYGMNKLESEEKESLCYKFLSTFKDPLILMLLGSCVLSVIVGQVYCKNLQVH